MIRCVGIILTDRPATCRVNFLRIFLLRPPEHLVEPVNAPVTQRAVCKVEIAPEPAWVDRFVVRYQWGRAAVKVPVHALWRLRIRRFLSGTAAVMNECTG